MIILTFPVLISMEKNVSKYRVQVKSVVDIMT